MVACAALFWKLLTAARDSHPFSHPKPFQHHGPRDEDDEAYRSEGDEGDEGDEGEAREQDRQGPQRSGRRASWVEGEDGGRPPSRGAHEESARESCVQAGVRPGQATLRADCGLGEGSQGGAQSSPGDGLCGHQREDTPGKGALCEGEGTPRPKPRVRASPWTSGACVPWRSACEMFLDCSACSVVVQPRRQP